MTGTATSMRVQQAGTPVLAARVPIQAPPSGSVRIRVVASGVCGADLGTVAASSRAAFPVTPGHEIAGVVAELGDGVAGWSEGDEVAVGWFGGSCGRCAFCRSGDVVHCPERMVPGLSYPGGWAESVTVPADALARVPEGLDLFDAAPMGCAGVTTFNAVRHAGVRAGGRIAVFGVGGLGHLAIQFAARSGYETIAIARGAERERTARGLGARHYIDSAATPPGEALREMGGADAIVSTVPSSAALSELIAGLRVRGRLIVVGIGSGAIEVPVRKLVMNAQTVTGHLTGSALDIEEAMRFALLHGIRPMIERVPLEAAQVAVERLAKGEARFRLVLDATADEERPI